MKVKGVVLALWIASAAWTASLFLAPATLPPGTVMGLDGAANVVDYRDQWAVLPAFHAVVYTLGDLGCHQMAMRSWSFGGNQMPVDARMTSGFAAATLGIAVALLVPSQSRVRDAALQVVPRSLREGWSSRQQTAVFVGMASFLAIPLLVDVTLQVLGVYESTNLRRAWTGSLFGFAAGCLLALLADSLTMGQSTREGRNVLP